MSDESERPVSPLTSAARDLGAQSSTFDFISSIIAGLLLGLGLDWWLGTSPILTVIGIVGGFVSGFIKLWLASASLEEQARERRRA